MEVKKIANLPVQGEATENTHVLIEENGAAKRIPASSLVPKEEIPEVEIPEDILRYSAQELTEEQKAQARKNIGAGVPVEVPEIPEIPEQKQADWNQNDETAPDFVKGRTHYSQTVFNPIWTDVNVDSNYCYPSIDDTGFSFKEAFAEEGTSGKIQIGDVVYDAVSDKTENSLMGAGNYDINLRAYKADGSELIRIKATKQAEVIIIVGDDSIAYPVSVSVFTESEEVKKLDPKYLTQPDWNESDPASAAYVQNRTHYHEQEVSEIMLAPTDFSEDDGNYSYSEVVEWNEEFEKLYGITTSLNKVQLVTVEAMEYTDFTPVAYTWGYQFKGNYIGNGHLLDASLEDTGEMYCIFAGYGIDGSNQRYCKVVTSENGYFAAVCLAKDELKQLDEKFIPELSGVVVKSSTEGSTKKFKITVDDSGMITATEVV